MITYTDAKDVEVLAKKLIQGHTLVAASQACIRYLFASGKSSTFLGRCSLAIGHWKFLTGYDYVIEIWKPFWDTTRQEDREALLLHELLHITQTKTKKGVTKWRIVRHDIEEFQRVYLLYGAWSPALQSFLAVKKEVNTTKTVGLGSNEG